MDKQAWLDAVPFYLNGTLNAQQIREFERTLQQHPDLQTELDAWRTIADAVYTDAQQRAHKLPPIAPRVRQFITSGYQKPPAVPNAQPDQPTLIPPPPATAERPMPRRIPKPQRNSSRTTQISVISGLVVLAAAVGLLMAAGVIYYAAITLNAPAGQVAAAPTDTPTRILGRTATPRPTQQPPTVTSPPTRPPATAVLPPTGIAAAPTQLPPPSVTVEAGSRQTPRLSIPAPNTGVFTPQGGIGGAASSQMADPLLTPNPAADPAQTTIMSQSAPLDCVAAPNTNQDVYVYAQPSTDSAVIWLLATDQTLPARTQTTPTDDSPEFYGVDLPQSQLERGWVLATQITLTAPDDMPCPPLPTPTP